MFFIGIITYTVAALKRSIKKFNYNIIKRIFTKSLDYSRLMKINDYISFEKYDIWRYCVHF
ncbi:hypothetical protein [Candidatus Clostridium radicumherbarum]|uniref:Uncharacterized protein n=1 Tax=Candidatus Clostridium radicumherbarum TaxID=3381662 RepID=A0ABW8TU15_9CLOT